MFSKDIVGLVSKKRSQMVLFELRVVDLSLKQINGFQKDLKLSREKVSTILVCQLWLLLA